MSVSIKSAVALAANTKRLMEDRGWSQRELGKRAKMSQRAVGYVLNYRDDRDRHASLETLELLAGAFKVRPEALLIEGFSSSTASNLLPFESRRTKKDQAHAKATPATLDTDLLETLIEGAQKLSRRTAKQKAELVASVYSKVVSGEESGSKDNVVKLLRSA